VSLLTWIPFFFWDLRLLRRKSLVVDTSYRTLSSITPLSKRLKFLRISLQFEYIYIYIYIYIYRVSKEEGTKLREGVPYVKLYRKTPKHPYPKLNGLGDNGN
jgi:hypothetical protein